MSLARAPALLLGLLALAPARVRSAELEPAAPGSTQRSPPARDVRPRGSGLVLANTYGLTFGLAPAPSLDLGLFLGAPLGDGAGRRRWALGHQLELSLGGAERYGLGYITLRHHFAAYTYASRGRLVASAGLGVAYLRMRPAVLEGEGRIAMIFGTYPEHRRQVGIVGVSARLGWNFYTMERVPMPQLGLFVGFLGR